MSSQDSQCIHVSAGSTGSSQQHLPLAPVPIASVADVNVTATTTTTSVTNDNVAILLQPSPPSLEPVQNKCA